MSALPVPGWARVVRPSPSLIHAAPLVALAIVWPFYVYDSSQVAWLMGTGLLAALACDLSARRDPLLAALLLGVVAVLGTEVSGDLAAGTAPLGSLRTLDVILVAAVAPRLGDLWPPRMPSIPVLALLAVTGYAVLLWAANEHPTDSLVRTDVRLGGLAAATWFVVRDLGPWRLAWVARAGAVVVLLTAAKAVALYASDYWTIGTFDRVQSSTVQPPGDALRVILVGGDTLMIIAPACLLALAYAVFGRTDRWLLAAAGGGAFLGLLISGTRTSLITAVALVIGVAAARLVERRRVTLTRRTAMIVILAAGALLAGAAASGTLERLFQSDAPGTGLDFRRQEIRSFLDLPVRDVLLGQGVGGRYIGKSAIGQPVEAGWSHAFPVVIALKAGVIGILAMALLLGAAAVRSALEFGRSRHPENRAMMACGATAVMGILLMSLTLGRAALPEGAVILVLGLAMLTALGGRTTCAR